MKDFPVIKVAILFVTGILSAHFIELSMLSIILSFIAILLLIIFYNKYRSNTYYYLLTLIFSGFLVFSIGNNIAAINKSNFNPFWTKIDKVKNTTAVGEIAKIDLIRDGQLIFYLSVDSIYSDEFLIKDELNILCKAKLSTKAISELYNELKPGNILKVTGFYHKGKEKRNPGEFDYDAYLNSKEILGILNINDISSIAILDSETNYFKNVIHQIRISIDNQIKKYISF